MMLDSNGSVISYRALCLKLKRFSNAEGTVSLLHFLRI